MRGSPPPIPPNLITLQVLVSAYGIDINLGHLYRYGSSAGYWHKYQYHIWVSVEHCQIDHEAYIKRELALRKKNSGKRAIPQLYVRTLLMLILSKKKIIFILLFLVVFIFEVFIPWLILIFGHDFNDNLAWSRSYYLDQPIGLKVFP